MTGAYPALSVARWFISWAAANDADDVTNLKLQKLLYYAQGWHLSLERTPLFSDDVQAWEHGPVVKVCYHEFKTHASDPIPADEKLSWSPPAVGPEATSLLVRVWDTYGSLSPWRLRDLTHSERPWRDAYRPNVANTVIHREALEAFFRDESEIALAPARSTFGDRGPLLLPQEDTPDTQLGDRAPSRTLIPVTIEE